MKKYLLVLLAVAALAAVACDRDARDYAMKKDAPAGSPSYQVAAKESAGALPVNVAEVFPTGKLDGQALFLKNCSACHQVTGQGIPGAFPPLDNSPYVTGDKVERMASIMLYGLMGPIHVNGNLYNNVMAPLGGTLKDDELAAIATYIRGAWSNKAAPVGPEVFAAQRTKWGARGMFQIAELGEEK